MKNELSISPCRPSSLTRRLEIRIMSKRFWYAASILLWASALMLTPIVDTVHAQEHEPMRIVLEITDAGYNCLEGCDNVLFTENIWGPTIEVKQGQLVELVFMWAHQAYPREEHIMVLEEYNLEWDEITYHNREASLRLIADQPGTFMFKCDLKCDLHDYMQRGYLTVTHGNEESGAALRSDTSLTLNASPSPWVAAGESVTVQSVLKDKEGAPVPRANILFYLDAEFAGVQQKMEVGKGRTDAAGTAALEFRPTLAMEYQNITARFEGMGVYAESQEVIELQVFGEPPPAYSLAPIGLESIRFGVSLGFIAVVLGVWMVFAFVAYQIVRIARAEE
jgi:hypothetical protein